jgi:glycosyltransferase involved in cell wall biosynthesis
MPPPVHGSALIGQYISQSKLVNENFDCSFINLSTSSQISDIGNRGYFKLITILKLYIKVLLMVIKYRYDLCYLTINSKGKGYYKEMIIVFILKLFNKKLVYHYHNKGITDQQINWLLNKVYRYQFKDSRAILLSRYLYPDVEKYLSQDRVYYCANGIPPAGDINLKLLNSKRALKEVVEILFLSHMMKQKGVFILLEACKILFQKNIGFKAYFIGAWSDIKENDFNSFVIANCLQEHILYLGAKYGEEKFTFFENSDIFVLPTFYNNEVFPLVLLEAMQYGLPIISTSEGAISEIVEDKTTGYIVPKGDSLALANKIKELIQNPDSRVIMGQNGHEKFEIKYRVEKFEQNFVNNLKQILSDFGADSNGT